MAPVLGWCAATVSSVALASVAMLPVLRTATPDESSLVSVDQLRDSGEAAPAPAPPPSTTPTAEPEPEPEPSATTTRTSKRTTEPTRTSAAPSPARTTTAAESTTTTEDGWTVTTDGDGARTYVRSFRVEGGSAVIRVTEDVVKVVTATPSDGYSVATVQNSPDNLAVYFNEVNHSFVIHVAWNINKPFAEVSEVGQ
ncbi:DNA mismatch repair protein MutL [Actinoplanes nipponensis]|uniref:DNA mismatch repair protein MutL n=1 Tax=Actinoplanes nipponensis TaxID=135950 RepID=UPI0035F02CFB